MARYDRNIQEWFLLEYTSLATIEYTILKDWILKSRLPLSLGASVEDRKHTIVYALLQACISIKDDLLKYSSTFKTCSFLRRPIALVRLSQHFSR